MEDNYGRMENGWGNKSVMEKKFPENKFAHVFT